MRSELEAPLEVRFAFNLCFDVYCVRVFIEKLLAVGVKLKQLVLDAANVLEVLVVALGSRCRHFAGVDLAVVPIVVEIMFYDITSQVSIVMSKMPANGTFLTE